MIQIKNLSYSYNPKSPFKKDALKDVTMTINDGEFFGIIGHTGSGKSTLVQHFNALIKLTQGSLVVGDIDLGARFDYKKLRSRVGMVFQYPEYQLFDETVQKDVGFGLRNVGVATELIPERVREAIEAVGLDYDAVKERSPFELSGGQKRRAAIAGVIAMRPEVLILDEPTAGLDPRGRREILALIHKIKAEFCPTIIMISHNMDEIADNCSRIAVLNKGCLEFVLPPSELFCHATRLREMGLDLPRVTQIADGLGYSGIYREADLVSAIVADQRFAHFTKGASADDARRSEGKA